MFHILLTVHVLSCTAGLEGLLESVHQFMETAPLGEFSARLAMLHAFSADMLLKGMYLYVHVHASSDVHVTAEQYCTHALMFVCRSQCTGLPAEEQPVLLPAVPAGCPLTLGQTHCSCGEGVQGS